MKLIITEADVEENIKNEDFCKMLNSIIDYKGTVILDEELKAANKEILLKKIKEWKSRYSCFNNN